MATPPSLRELLLRIDELQLFPAAAQQVLSIARNSSATRKQLEEAVATDPVLAGRVIKLANSPMFARAVRVETLEHAIRMLGFHGTRDVALALALAGVGKERTEAGEELWRHARWTAVSARTIGEHLRRGATSSAFISALLHDVGRQLMLVLEPKRMAGLHATDECNAIVAFTREREVFGVDHAKLGAACLRRWSFSEHIAVAVENHHRNAAALPDAGLRREVAVLQFADVLAHTMADGLDLQRTITVAQKLPAVGVLGISEHSVGRIVRRVFLSKHRVASLAA